MEIDFICTYCGHKWCETLYSERSTANQRCPICNDKYPSFRPRGTSDIDYYAGSPPFPPKEPTVYNKTEEPEHIPKSDQDGEAVVEDEEPFDGFQWLG